jgi:cell wall assembly regulator SMI1
MKRKRIIGLGLLVTVTILVLGWILIPRMVREFFYPQAPTMPPVVTKSVENILTELENLLKVKAPKVFSQMQPGLSNEQISTLEYQAGIQLPEDIKSLYRWHNGCKSHDPLISSFIPGQRFLSLEETLALHNASTNDLAKQNEVQKVAFDVFAGHTKSWITLFDDGCGDGYFFDPERKPSDGAIFYHFAEDGAYVFFPSIKNLLAGIVKCYERGTFVWKDNSSGSGLGNDFKRSEEIWLEYGVRNFK